MRRANYFKGAANRDANEPKITAVLDAYHFEYSKGNPGDGYDICLHIQPMRLLEIKNPEQPLSKRKLTDAELAKQAYCKRHGIPYDVIEYSDQIQVICEKYNSK